MRRRFSIAGLVLAVLACAWGTAGIAGASGTAGIAGASGTAGIAGASGTAAPAGTYAGSSGATAHAGQAAATAKPKPGAPNVLFIMLDDARPDALQYMPKTRKWFTAAGTTFTDATTANPNCCPARSAFFSGQYPHNNHVLRQKDAKKLDQRYTLQAYLKRAGYATAMSGKYLTSWPKLKAPPSFDKYTYIKSGYYNYSAQVDGATVRLGNTDADYSSIYLTNQLQGYLDGFVKSDPAKPWYGYLAFQAPHLDTPEDGGSKPPVPQAKYATAKVTPDCVQPGEADKSDKPPYLQTFNVKPTYVGSLCRPAVRTLMTVDDEVDALMTHLQDTGQLSHTIAFIASDNGFLDGEHNAIKKFEAYTPSSQIPLVMRWDGHVAAGATDNRPVSLIDVAPTILKVLNIAQKVPMDGRSLLDTSFTRQYIFSEYYQDPSDLKFVPSWATIQNNDWQYTEYFDDAFNITFREYYNLKTDPNQLTNLLADGNSANDPPNLDQLHQDLQDARQCSGANCP